MLACNNKLLSKFVNYLIKNDSSINYLLDNFIENGLIVREEYNTYLDNIKKKNQEKSKIKL
jgi:lysine/ornithine N-monooxygenase